MLAQFMHFLNIIAGVLGTLYVIGLLAYLFNWRGIHGERFTSHEAGWCIILGAICWAFVIAF